MNLMGLTDEDEVLIEFVGDTMLVRAHDRGRPDAIDLLDGMVRLTDVIELKPEHVHLAEHLRLESRQRLLLHLLHDGPKTAAEVTSELGVSRHNTNVTLRKLAELGLIRIENAEEPGANRYAIAAEMFEP